MGVAAKILRFACAAHKKARSGRAVCGAGVGLEAALHTGQHGQCRQRKNCFQGAPLSVLVPTGRVGADVNISHEITAQLLTRPVT